MKYHRNIPYEYHEWITYTGKQASGYSCEAFDECPYYVTIATAQTEDGIKERIDYFLPTEAEYEARRKLSNASAAAYYEDTTRYQGD